MQCGKPGGVREFTLLVLLIVGLASFPRYVFAKKDAKTYPEEGKVVATGLTEWVINRQHQYAHTYTVVTNSKSYVLECSHKPVFGTMGEDCGGTKKLQIGDVIHFRIESDRAYIPITKADNSTGEEKLRILSTGLRPEASAAPPNATANPPTETN